MYRKFAKRLFDIVFSLAGMIAASPLLLAAAVVLAAANNGSPFFIQCRPGKNARMFSIVKFKTMNDKRDADGRLLPDADRLHKTGRIIRSLSIDELPQLMNVLAGDMSFVGPRPLLPEYLPYYDGVQARRHEMRPGITGWAQVNGRNAISWERKFEYDVWYVDNVSFALDMKILWLTVRKVVFRDGINAAGQATMMPFDKYCIRRGPTASTVPGSHEAEIKLKK